MLLVTWGLVGLVFLVAFYGIVTGNYLLQLGLVLAPILIFLINRPDVWLCFVIAIYQSQLILPFMPQGLQAYHLFAFGFVIVMIANRIITKETRQKWTWSRGFVYLFLALLLFTAFVRGFGLRVFGGSSWGGMAYIQLFIMAGLLLVGDSVTLTTRQWRNSIIVMLLLSALPALAQLVFQLSNGKIYFQYNFIRAEIPALVGSLRASQTDTGVVRYNLLAGFGQNLLAIALVLFPFRGKYKFFVSALIVISVILGMISGFRSSLLITVGVLMLYVLLQGRGRRVTGLIAVGGACLLLLLAITPFARHLPMSMQRTLSIIPFIDVSLEARADALGSSLWRVEIWRQAWLQVPDYLLIGKGLAINPEDLSAMMGMRTDSVTMALMSHTYHNGPLALLLDLGVLGLVVGSGFLIASSIEFYKRLSTPIEDPLLRRAYCFYTAYYIYQVLNFFFIYGDLQSFTMMFMFSAILWGIIRTAEQQYARNKASSSTAPFRWPSARPPSLPVDVRIPAPGA